MLVSAYIDFSVKGVADNSMGLVYALLLTPLGVASITGVHHLMALRSLSRPVSSITNET